MRDFKVTGEARGIDDAPLVLLRLFFFGLDVVLLEEWLPALTEPLGLL